MQRGRKKNLKSDDRKISDGEPQNLAHVLQSPQSFKLCPFLHRKDLILCAGQAKTLHRSLLIPFPPYRLSTLYTYVRVRTLEIARDNVSTPSLLPPLPMAGLSLVARRPLLGTRHSSLMSSLHGAFRLLCAGPRQCRGAVLSRVLDWMLRAPCPAFSVFEASGLLAWRT